MHSLIQKYLATLGQANAQTNVDRFKHLIMCHADKWDWVDSDSFIADILNHNIITADDIVEMLKSIVAYHGGNREFEYTVLAMESHLRRERNATQIQLDDIDLSEINNFKTQDYQDYREAI